VEPNLVILRDPQRAEFTAEQLEALAQRIQDPNYRLFVAENQLHLLSAGMHLHDTDPFALFERLLAQSPRDVDASHAFYLGYEFAKAVTAMTLGKHYEQDEALNWGYLTVPEKHHAPKPARTKPAPLRPRE
jgi:dihydropteroate synthase